MFKHMVSGILLVAAVGLLTFGVAHRVLAGTDRQIEMLPPAASNGVDDAEAEALRYMREEEKLARDSYRAFYKRWALSIFANISNSEQMHMDAILTLLVRYNLSDPASTKAGVFTNPHLQALYDVLQDKGSQSPADALKAGCAIEEIDILDLQAYLAITDNADIQQVFNNLIEGSKHHLRAFVTTLERQTGETYQPQYLSEEAYQAILNESTGGGGSGGNTGGCGSCGGGHGKRP